MKLHELKPAPGSTQPSKRIGRGQGTGKGGTSTRGTKGAKSRSGYHRKWGFEGGQMPLQRRIPKYGFKNPFRTEYDTVNLDTLQRLSETHNVDTFSSETLRLYGMCKRKKPLKILGRGELSKALTVRADAFSKTAREAIEKAGGTVETP
jgi:large subunit ribosomal protein L15